MNGSISFLMSQTVEAVAEVVDAKRLRPEKRFRLGANPQGIDLLLTQGDILTKQHFD